jgi:hypothetical protein
MYVIFTQDELLEGYCKLENVDELFKSDLLILPSNKEGEGSFVNQLTKYDMEIEYPEISVEYYCRSEPEVRVYICNQDSIDYYIPGAYVILKTIAVPALCSYLRNIYKNNPIEIDVVVKIGDNKFIKIFHKDNVLSLEIEITTILNQNN